MRLFNIDTYRLEEFVDVQSAPRYAILSHTWGTGEARLYDLERTDVQELAARRDGYQYIWIDTCCIDKKNLTELSEAINSMFEWYKEAEACYVFLGDLQNCRWFTRGWTLQELIAPRKLRFFDRSWDWISAVTEDEDDLDIEDEWMPRAIPRITGIHPHAFNWSNFGCGQEYLDRATAAEKFSWAATRKTTRREDMAYSLLGILGVNMPLLYGEGNRAFIRLQEEYIRQHNDPKVYTRIRFSPPFFLPPDMCHKGELRTIILTNGGELYWTNLHLHRV
ncbi:heterokaryon incompatibility protein-domain-containing protein [Xylariaceae sp. FL0016]|nr:heterokaryon incompatibility protein-domain-containing protein [Xylariaceae sp. FL0016]